MLSLLLRLRLLAGRDGVALLLITRPPFLPLAAAARLIGAEEERGHGGRGVGVFRGVERHRVPVHEGRVLQAAV